MFETTQPLSVMAAAVAQGAADLLAEHGEERYMELWVEDPFPSETLRLVRARLQG